MGKRFSRLRAALGYLRPSGSNMAAEIPDAPAGTQLRKFQEFESGKVRIDYTRGEDSKPGELLLYQLSAFGLPAGADNLIFVPFSERAQQHGLAPFGLSIGELGIAEGTKDAKEVAGFQSAKAICRIQEGAPGSARTSQITGVSYRPVAARSYTLPFGRSGTRVLVSEQQSFILQQVEAQTAVTGVNFLPERL
jgi:hypothetical protein